MKKSSNKIRAGAIHSHADQEMPSKLLWGGAVRFSVIVAIHCILCRNRECAGITVYADYQEQEVGEAPNPRQRAVPSAASPPGLLAPAFWRLFNRPEISLE